MPVFTVFMDPSRIEDPVICGGGEGFYEDNKIILKQHGVSDKTIVLMIQSEMGDRELSAPSIKI